MMTSESNTIAAKASADACNCSLFDRGDAAERDAGHRACLLSCGTMAIATSGGHRYGSGRVGAAWSWARSPITSSLILPCPCAPHHDIAASRGCGFCFLSDARAARTILASPWTPSTLWEWDELPLLTRIAYRAAVLDHIGDPGDDAGDFVQVADAIAERFRFLADVCDVGANRLRAICP